MTTQPTISIVIPTHNRGDLVSLCIASAVQQTSRDYEIIVSDNSSNPVDSQKVKEAVEKAKQDANVNVKLIRPPTVLNMSNHFEFATKQFAGKYLAILTDHYALRPSAVEVWCSIIDASDEVPDILMSNIRSGYSEITRMESTWQFDKSITVKPAAEVLGKFLKFDAWNEDSMLATPLPRGMNSLYRAEVCDRIRQKHGGLFFPLSPDYTSSFLLLPHSKTVTYIDRPFYCHYGNQSNGRDCVQNGTEKFVATYPGLDPFEHCPTKIEAVQNTLYRDFEAMKRLEPLLQEYSIDLHGYYLSLYREILVKEFHGTQLDTKKLRSVWSEHVALLAPSDQKVIEERKKLLQDRESRNNNSLRKILTSWNLTPTVKSMVARGRAIKKRFQGDKAYQNVLEAVANTDHYILDNTEQQ